MSCYNTDGSQGIELYYASDGVRIRANTDTSTRCGYRNYRGCVVIRHTKGENAFRTYVFDANTNDNYADAISYNFCNATNVIAGNDANVIFGARYDNTDGYVNRYANGTIHMCKLWYADLGDAECREIVRWTHETSHYECYMDRKYRLADGTGYSNLSFIKRGLFEKLHQMNTSSTNVGGWDASRMRIFMNGGNVGDTTYRGRIYDSLPNIWHQLIKKVRVKATEGNQSSSILTSEDFIYLPSYTEVGGSSSSPYINELTNETVEDKIPWFTADKYRLKFRCQEVPDDVQFFSSSSDPSLDNTLNIKEGDIWIRTSESNIGYILKKVTGKALTGDTVITSSIEGYSWIRAQWYWERSPNVSYATGFYLVYYSGIPGSYNGASYSGGVCSCFSI
jgi:hypothetical protein